MPHPLKQRLSERPIFAVLMITLTAVLTLGVFIPRLGYYHDDWYMLWSAASRGVQSLIPLFSLDRPFMGFIYTIYYRIAGDSIPGWHLLALAWRIAGACAFYWILNLVWPKLKSLSVLAAMLFVVYPGFLAEPNAATKVNHLTGYAGVLFSIAFTLLSVKTLNKTRKVVFTGLALLLMAFYLWIYEYMIGLEVMRLTLVLWMLWRGERGKFGVAVKRTFLMYLPYIAVGVVFLYWRAFVFESFRYATDFRGLARGYRDEPVAMLLRLVFQVVKDFLSTTVFAWSVQAYTLFNRSTYTEILIALAPTAAMLLVMVGYIKSMRGELNHKDDKSDESPVVMILIGALITLAAVAPVVISDRRLDLMDQYKGYGLHPSAGVMILFLGIIRALKPQFRHAALVGLITLSVVTQGLNAQRWANFWDIQRSFWWQVTWRVPKIADNTLFMALIPDGYALQQDYEVWGPANLIYHPEPLEDPLIQSEVLNRDTANYIFLKTFQGSEVRDIKMPRNFAKVLLASQPTTQSCVHIIDGSLPVYSASERLIVEKVGAYSNIDLIDPTGTAPVPPHAIFGDEPARGWCYFYQQAGLARQLGDWQRIAALYDTASSEGLRPDDSSEYFVFVEGLASAGRSGDARKVASEINDNNDALKVSICQSLQAAAEFPDGYDSASVIELFCN